ncbi:glutathionylspermidine synthase family protein [Kiloniella laminariae]|uniref:glutathionylspermidine synthase family protein n=1 Tax=Kiloniella laminariae TaxID=454162 RepID=UPI00036A1B2D|nr:glutathionylspermidine synthase family protein [Kiloniella laminariae]
MERISIEERDDWRSQAEEVGFDFHTFDGEPYWDETACYRFSLAQIENDIEDPSADIENLCFEVVERAINDSEVMARLAIPETFWDYIRNSWLNREKNLYGRLDFSYDGKGPAKLLEYNADTPTALYESAVFQWLWLEQAMEREIIPAGCDQFNSLHEALVEAFKTADIEGPFHLASCQGSPEDEGTVRYLEECARQAGLNTKFLYIEDIGIDPDGHFTDLDDMGIATLFKLYPWEWIMNDEFGKSVPNSGLRFIEPGWKAILSNKGLMPLLWEMFEGHPNLLPSFFEDDPRISQLGDLSMVPGLTSGYVRKPLFSREGSNVQIIRPGQRPISVEGPYGSEGAIIQALHPLPVFEGNHTVIGSWLVASKPCGIGIREDDSPITKDSSRFLPHVIY